MPTEFNPLTIVRALRTTRIVSTGLLALSITAPAAIAQDNSTTAADAISESAAESSFRFSLSPYFKYTFDSEIDRGNDDYSVARAGVDYAIAWQTNEQVDLILGLGYEYSNYDFDTPNTFLAGTSEPFSDIHIFDVGLTARVKTDQPEWSWFAGVNGRFAGESDVDLSDGGAIDGMIGVSHQFSDDFSASAGVVVASRIEDDVLVVPFVGVDWQLDESTDFSIKRRWRGLVAELTHTYDDGMEIGVGAGWENRRFRLDDDPVGMSAVIDDTSFPVYARLGYQADECLSFDLVGGIVAFQEFEISDRNGNNEREFESDPTGFVQLSLTYRF